jgi:hypothetical protein
MRRGSSTIVSVVGGPAHDLVPILERVANVAGFQADGTDLDAAVDAFARAQGAASAYVVVGADPLSEVASGWHAMWGGMKDGTALEVAANRALDAWRRKRFELPDYYLVLVQLPDEREPWTGADFYLGFLKSERSARVVGIASGGDLGVTAQRALQALARLPQGPWWPSLDRIVESSRTYFPGRLATGAERDIQVTTQMPK